MDSDIQDSGMNHVRQLLNETPIPPRRPSVQWAEDAEWSGVPDYEARCKEALFLLDDAYNEIWRKDKAIRGLRFMNVVLCWVAVGLGAALVVALAIGLGSR